MKVLIILTETLHVKRVENESTPPDPIGDDDMTAIVDLSADCPWVGDGGGVAATICLCFSKIDSRIPEIRTV